jgi:hypothetical protein
VCICISLLSAELTLFFLGRYMNSSAFYFNYMLRLIPESTEGPSPSDITDVETKLFGLHSQLTARVRCSISFLLSLRGLLTDVEHHRDSNLSMHERQNSNSVDGIMSASRRVYECLSRLTALCRRASVGLSGLVVNLCLASIVLSSQCGDPHLCAGVAPLCKQAYIILKDSLDDSTILQELLQSYVDLCVHSYLQQTPTKSISASSENVAWTSNNSLLIYTVASHLVLQSRKTAQTIDSNIQGLAAVLTCELNLRACISIFTSALSLRETDFLRKFGYASSDLLKSIHDKMRSLIDWFVTFHCLVTTPQTIVSVYTLIDGCLNHCDA